MKQLEFDEIMKWGLNINSVPTDESMKREVMYNHALINKGGQEKITSHLREQLYIRNKWLLQQLEHIRN